MVKHYANAVAACLFAFLWGYQVSRDDAIRASVDVLFVVYYVHEAKKSLPARSTEAA